MTFANPAIDTGTDVVGAATIAVLGLLLLAVVSLDRWRRHRRNR